MAEVGNLTATLSLDTDGFQQGVDDATKQTNVFADVLDANLATKAIGLAISALEKLGEVAANTFKDAIQGYADYEQYVGGVEKLFKDSSDTILNYAENAYETAGISANQYMELATSFSGALIKSTGRGVQEDLDQLETALDEEYKETKRHLEDQYEIEKDYWDKKINATKNSGYKEALRDQRDEALKDLKRANEDQLAEIKAHNKEVLAEAEATNAVSVNTAESLASAADLTQMAIVDMADQANTYGKTVAEVSQTYTSLAKGIYTTLDNLFGGMFAGTKQGLQELLDYAENYRAGLGETVSYSMDSYADIVSAIHDVSEALEISGTTAKEASNTVSGSISAMKAAWKNLINGLGNDKADLDKLIDDFFEKANTAWEKLEPVAERVLDGMIQLVIDGLPKFVDLGLKIGEAILKGLAKLLLKPLAWLADKVSIGITGYDLGGNLRASGGPVEAGVPYVTGELGPELFVPKTDGYILNNEDTESLASGLGGINITIQGDVYDDELSMRQKISNAVRGVLETELAYG